MFSAANIAKPGCRPQCGKVKVPYPFGIGKDCSMGFAFTFTCKSNNSSSEALFFEQNEIIDISETQLRVAVGPIPASCNSSEVGGGDHPANFDATGIPFALSSDANKFWVTGCHHYGLMEAYTRKGRQGLSCVTCVALCTQRQDLLDGACSGIGCCQAPIPKGLKMFNTTTKRINYDGADIPSGNCSYAFVVDKSSFAFHGAIDLQDPEFPNRIARLPSVMEWFAGIETCRYAQQNKTTYACQQNTKCIDLDQVLDVKEYCCECQPGYEGNPYLSPGCTDIDECERTDNPCSDICINTPGGYNCSCPSGHHGDGRKNGRGCVPNSFKLVFALGLGIGLGTIHFLLGGFWLLIAVRRRKEVMQRAKNFKRNVGLLLQQQMSSKEGMVDKTRVYTAEELEKATDHFNEDRAIGRGGQGTVYKGMLSDGNIVAIKKSNIVDQRQLDAFINEVVILSQINHRNIIKLLGCCLETDVPLLVYEFILNGSLSKHIHDPSEDFPITWEMRLQIAKDVAGALTYMHSASSKPIFHRDIKTCNILLDAKYRAKVSDFGTSRSIAIDQTHLTSRVIGTFGYLDPEYFQSNQFTEKSDVYSFGVVLVDLLTGQKAVHATESSRGESLVSWFLWNLENSNLYDILADRVANEASLQL